MGLDKIPVWVYTAKNGYAWQGLDVDGEDRPTVTLLDKALAVAGNTAGAWGAVVRRPVASRHWKEWPSSRLCWVLFRFHPDACRDLRGRRCNYIAAACIPAGLPPLDFEKIFHAPEMSEVKAGGFDKLLIDFEKENLFLHERGGDASRGEADPSWAESWPSPVLVKEDTFQTLSRWCQGGQVDKGDFKALLRAGADRTEVVVAQATFAVYPQVAAAQQALAAYERVRGKGGTSELTALDGWGKEIESVRKLNHALGGLKGVETLLAGWSSSREQAVEAFNLAEKRTRERAAAVKAAAEAAAALDRRLAQFQMSADPMSGTENNRKRLEALAKTLSDARIRHGDAISWEGMESRLDQLRQAVEAIEGHLDTVRAYWNASQQDSKQDEALESQAREASDQARILSRGCGGRFAENAMKEITRLFKAANKEVTSGSVTKQWLAERPAPACPVKFGTKAHGNSASTRKQEEEPPRQKQRNWLRWALLIAALLPIMTCLGLWASFSAKAGREMWEKKTEAVQFAYMGQYGEALNIFENMPQHVWYLQFKSRYVPEELRESWKLQEEFEGKNKEANSAKEEVEKREKESEIPPAYREALDEAKKQAEACPIPEIPSRNPKDGVYLCKRKVLIVFSKGSSMSIGELKELDRQCDQAKRAWEEALSILKNAESERLYGKNLERLKIFSEAATEAQKQHVALRTALGADFMEHKYAADVWKEYTSSTNQALQLTKDVHFDDVGNPFRLGQYEETIRLEAMEVEQWATDYENAVHSWGKAGSLLAKAILRERFKAADDARKKFEKQENESDHYRQYKDLAPDDWTPYEKAAGKAQNAIPKGSPSLRESGASKLDIRNLKDLIDSYKEAEKQWGIAADSLAKAYKKIVSSLQRSLKEEQTKAEGERRALEELEAGEKDKKMNCPTLSPNHWKKYQSWKGKAEETMNQASSGLGNMPSLPSDLEAIAGQYKAAAENWRKARLAFEEACKEIDSLKDANSGGEASQPPSPSSEGAAPSPEDSSAEKERDENGDEKKNDEKNAVSEEVAQ